MTTNGHGDHYGPDDDTTVVDDPAPALAATLDRIARFATGMRESIPRLQSLTPEARRTFARPIARDVYRLIGELELAVPLILRLGPAVPPAKP